LLLAIGLVWTGSTSHSATGQESPDSTVWVSIPSDVVQPIAEPQPGELVPAEPEITADSLPAGEDTFQPPESASPEAPLQNPPNTIPLEPADSAEEPDSGIIVESTEPSGYIDGDDRPWWNEFVVSPMFNTATEPITPDLLVFQALQNSPYLRAISREPLIREQQITEACARFDPELFAKTLYDDRVDPVGNLLTTGGLPFLEDNIWTGSAGVRRKLARGGDLEISQKLGFQNSNSRFFDPQDQGTATLAINLNQPLMRGAGYMYNRSQILIAQANHDAAWETFLVGFQDELIAIGEAYWNLAYRRGILLQKQKNVQRGADVLAKLQGRSGLDSVPSQILRAQAAVASRQTELSNAVRDVENAQTEIRRLIGDRHALASQGIELIPTEAPSHDYFPYDLTQVAELAAQNRAEVREAVHRAKAAAIDSDIGRNEMLPELNLIFKTYVSGLEGDTGIEQAWQEQFTNTTPGFAAGLEYAVPYGRRAAKSRLTARQLRVRKVNEEVEVALLRVVSEAHVAARQLDSAQKTMQAAAAAIAAGKAELDYQYQRWESFALIEGDFAEGQSPVTLLDQLLDSQQRLSNAEAIYSQSELEFKRAQLALQRATGTIAQVSGIEFDTTCEDGLPAVQFNPHNRQ
jgi:outer membrane protein TolC